MGSIEKISVALPADTLVMVRAAVENGLQFTAHTVGDGAVDVLLDAYEEVDRTIPVRKSRSSITHSNFMSKEAVARAARLGVPVDSYGVGSALIRGENDFTADVVLTDGRPSAKVGRWYRPNPRLERVA